MIYFKGYKTPDCLSQVGWVAYVFCDFSIIAFVVDVRLFVWRKNFFSSLHFHCGC